MLIIKDSDYYCRPKESYSFKGNKIKHIWEITISALKVKLQKKDYEFKSSKHIQRYQLID